MESESELGFINYPFYNKGSIIESVVYDNDPTEKALLKQIFLYMKANNTIFLNPHYSEGTNRNDTGKLPHGIPEPHCYAEPTQCQNILGEKIWYTLG